MMDHIVNEGVVKTELLNKALKISFSHPKSNSLPSKILTQLAQAIKEWGENEAANVIILASEGRNTFCSGASFNELCLVKTQDEAVEFFKGFVNVLLAMRNCPKFILGRVQGKSVGGGVGLIAGADYCLATHQSNIKLSELSIGIGPFVIGPALMRKMGVAAFSQLAINSKNWFSAAWAQQHGLFTDIFETVEEMDKAIDQLSTELSNYSPKAMAEIKRMLWAGTENWEKILVENAKKSGRLLLEDATQETIKNLLKST